MAEPTELLHGTLDVLILKTLSWGPRHGYAIARWLEEATGEALQIEDGSLYPALYRLEQREMIKAEWGTSELGRKAKFYRITTAGRRRLAASTEEWARATPGEEAGGTRRWARLAGRTIPARRPHRSRGVPCPAAETPWCGAGSATSAAPSPSSRACSPSRSSPAASTAP